jgi:hypothetical protein
VLQQIYDPRRYCQRVQWATRVLRPAGRHRAPLADLPRLVLAFLRVCRQAGWGRKTGWLYWKTLLAALLRNPRSAVAVANLAAMHGHLSKQSEHVVRVLGDRIAYVRTHGENWLNARMVTGQTP